MTNQINNSKINNKSNTSLLVEYLEPLIGDEMIMNSFIRDINIVKKDEKEVVISFNSLQAKYYAEKECSSLFLQAIENVFETPLEVKFVVGNEIVDNAHNVVPNNLSQKFTFETYVRSNFNEEAYEIGERITKNFGFYSPLFIYGKSGIGKTHLLHAIGHRFAKDNKSVFYVEPNKFTKNVTELSKEGGSAISNYAEKLKGFDVLLFDDIQILGDRSVTLRVLFEIINHHIEEGKQIVIASDKSPIELSGFESRFITRFSSGFSTQINSPEIADLIKVLTFKIKVAKMNPEDWDKEALSFIARNNSSSIRAIEGAIKRVVFYTENEENIKYTHRVISNIFKQLTIDPIELTPERIISTVSNYYGFSTSYIVGKSRKKEYVLARHISIYIIRSILNLSYVEIGKLFSNRDHSTIINSIKKIDYEMQSNKLIKLAITKIEQKIKSIS